MISEAPVRALEEIEGIGPSIAEQLRSRRVYCCGDLLGFEPALLSGLAKSISGLTRERLQSSILPQARLLQVDELPGQAAEGLAASGIHTLLDLVEADAEDLAAKLKVRQEGGLIPTVPTMESLLEWQRKAGVLQASCRLTLRCARGETGVDIEDVEFTISTMRNGTPIWFKAPAGEFMVARLRGIPPGPVRIRAESSGLRPTVCGAIISVGQSMQLLVPIRRGRRHTVVVDEFEGRQIGPIRRGWIVRTRHVDAEEFPFIPPAGVVEFLGDKVRLCSVLRRREDEVVHVRTFDVLRTAVPADVQRGDVVAPTEDGLYKKLEQSLFEFRLQLERESRA